MPDAEPNTRFIYVVVGFAALGGMLFGFDQGNWAGAIAKPGFARQFCGGSDACHDAQKYPDAYTRFLSLGSSLIQLGAACSAPTLAPMFASRYGRRETMFAGSLIVILGVIPQTLTSRIWLFLLARFVAGFGVGTVTYAIPMYVSEISPPESRGMLGSMMQLLVITGCLVAALLNSAPWFGFAWSFSLPAFPAGIIALGIFCLPASPRELITRAQQRGCPEVGIEQARTSLQRLRGSDELAEVELVQLQGCLLLEGTEQAPWSTLWTEPSIRRRVVVACMLQWMQQFTGVNAILSDGPLLLGAAGVPISGQWSLVIADVFAVVGTIVMMLVVDRWGRRLLLLLGAALMLVCLVLAAVLTLFISRADASSPSRAGLGWALLACVCCYMAFFSIAWGGVPWIYPSEIFPMMVKEKALTMSVFSQWIANFVIAYIVPAQLVHMGPHGTFFFFAGCLALTSALVYWLVPETKGRVLEDMDEIFGGKGRKTKYATM